jgi:hypothetical protein
LPCETENETASEEREREKEIKREKPLIFTHLKK